MPREISIRELFADIGHDEYVDARGVNINRVKVLVKKKICSPPIRMKNRGFFRKSAVALVALGVLLSSVGVYAAATGTLFGVRVFGEAEKEELQRPQYATITDSRIEPEERRAYGYSTRILNEEYLSADSEFGFNSVGTICGESTAEGVGFSDFIFDNGDVVILAMDEGAGWALDAGERMTLSFRQNTEDNPHAGSDANQLDLGIIIDGVPAVLTAADSLTTEYSFTAQSKGTYYFYIKNYSSEKIVIAGCFVN